MRHLRHRPSRDANGAVRAFTDTGAAHRRPRGGRRGRQRDRCYVCLRGRPHGTAPVNHPLGIHRRLSCRDRSGADRMQRLRPWGTNTGLARHSGYHPQVGRTGPPCPRQGPLDTTVAKRSSGLRAKGVWEEVLRSEIPDGASVVPAQLLFAMNKEALCAAPPEALTHSPSQMPLSCPVAPQAARS